MLGDSALMCGVVKAELGELTVSLTHSPSRQGMGVKTEVRYAGRAMVGDPLLAEYRPLVSDNGLNRIWLAPGTVQRIADFQSAHGV